MVDWKNRVIPQNKTKTGKWYIVDKASMKEMSIKDFRKLMESHWKEFEK